METPEKFKIGQVVYLRSDLPRTVPMTVVSDHTETRKEVVPYKIDMYNLGQEPPATEYTGKVFKTRTVTCTWFNSQRVILKNKFPPETLTD